MRPEIWVCKCQKLLINRLLMKTCIFITEMYNNFRVKLGPISIILTQVWIFSNKRLFNDKQTIQTNALVAMATIFIIVFLFIWHNFCSDRTEKKKGYFPLFTYVRETHTAPSLCTKTLTALLCVEISMFFFSC